MNTEERKDPSKDAEQALTPIDPGQYLLKLYVAGMTPRSLESIAALRMICEKHLMGRYSIEVIDIQQHPEQAREQQILAVPTLIRELPSPLRKLIGRLTDEERVLKGLNVQARR